MRRFARRHLALRGVPAVVVAIAVAATGTVASGAAYVMTSEPKAERATPGRAPAAAARPTTVVPASEQPSALKHVVPPDFLVISGQPVSKRQLAKVSKLAHVRDVITVDAGAVRLQGGQANMFAVDPVRFRAWTPLGTATDDALWTALSRDQFVVSDDVQRQLGLRSGMQYAIQGRTQLMTTMGGAGSLGLPGINVLVGRTTGRRIGLVPDIGLLVNAPGADLDALQGGLRRAVGAQSQIINLHEKQYQPQTNKKAPRGRPTSYLQLYQQAAGTCPGLSWTVLAAIGQIESDHGRNVGPSSAGALGPMQFMPATWRSYGVDGDGDGKADIMDPFDAVPAAAKYLCASGAGRGSLSKAIWAYNHSQAYVNAVLNLAHAYARRFS
ncbi:lytic transglycosylase domain-containing protein [Actinoallomurus sp. NBC_01490]|uniref:lytic transglycosylase domain-containing protein n=1 Tax=Actinoallomurus sp. NBC_01490 TaxID=2903557 RepID=UPI002E35278A|nr:lytic transglycosylase domain-containing protein [Actinoallomurus sp. NBC_01490]